MTVIDKRTKAHPYTLEIVVQINMNKDGSTKVKSI